MSRGLSAWRFSGYRPFAQFSAELGPLTVIIGANASGKSSLFDLLRLLAFAAESPLPPEIRSDGTPRSPRCSTREAPSASTSASQWPRSTESRCGTR